jgi:hypothetical protein
LIVEDTGMEIQAYNFFYLIISETARLTGKLSKRHEMCVSFVFKTSVGNISF